MILLGKSGVPGLWGTETAIPEGTGTRSPFLYPTSTVRYRLNRGGDRQLNRALHTIVLSRIGHHEETKAYVARRTAEGRTSREIRRCLKRHLARRLFKLLESSAAA